MDAWKLPDLSGNFLLDGLGSRTAPDRIAYTLDLLDEAQVVLERHAGHSWDKVDAAMIERMRP